ncbi:MAG: hypothetical protein IT196_10640 [Acidimicrobiales bacterium]|nr:hypothetical protein [Acidimicrobiales bacterium]
MLVHDFALVTLPGADMAEAMQRRGRDLLAGSVAAALHGPDGPAPFRLQTGGLLSSSQSTVLPFTLHLERQRSAFRQLQGDLEFFELEPRCCQLRLLASYGRLDPFAPTRVDHARVETTVRTMLNHLVRALEAEAARSCHG